MYIEASSVHAQSVKAVYLDGIKVNWVIRLDTEAGWVEVYDTDEYGEFKIVDGDVSTKILYGEVYVTYKNPFQE